MNYEFDDLDLAIVDELSSDARKAFTEIAKKLGVSGGTIHVRVDRMRSLGVIKGSSIEVDFRKIGFTISTFIGVRLDRATLYRDVLLALKELPEVTEAYYTTGQYNILIKAYLRSVEDLHSFLVERLQGIPGVHSTETLLVLDSSIQRSPKLSAA